MLLARSAKRTGLDVAFRRAAAKATPAAGVSMTPVRSFSSAPGLECECLLLLFPSYPSCFFLLSLSRSHRLHAPRAPRPTEHLHKRLDHEADRARPRYGGGVSVSRNVVQLSPWNLHRVSYGLRVFGYSVGRSRSERVDE